MVAAWLNQFNFFDDNSVRVTVILQLVYHVREIRGLLGMRNDKSFQSVLWRNFVSENVFITIVIILRIQNSKNQNHTSSSAPVLAPELD